MVLDKRYYSAFDRTYADVTRRIERVADKLNAPDADWLRRLVQSFQHERDLWDARPELSQYRQRWTFFRSGILRLVAGAYLHIGYDLPRAIADDWPGTGVWQNGPNSVRGRQIYYGLQAIFAESLIRSSRDPRTVGLAAIFARVASRNALTSASIWVDNLRQGAWVHADILATAHDREFREAQMAAAMTAALEDVSLIRPWTILHLGPPHAAFFTSGWTTAVTVLPPLLHLLGDVLAIAFVSSVLTERVISKRAKLHTIGDFIFAWGQLLNDYLAKAVREPEGFAAYREARRAEFGIPSPLGGLAT